MNLTIDPRYNTYAISIVFYLLHNNEDYKNIWIENFPETEHQANNFFKDENCGCRPVLLQKYKKFRFDADVITVKFLNENPEALDFDDFCTNIGGQELRGTMFSVPNTEGDYKDFLASLQQKKAIFSHFNVLQMGEKILITFF